jgi:hypothetical protein
MSPPHPPPALLITHLARTGGRDATILVSASDKGLHDP